MDKFYTIKEVCDILKMSRSTLYRIMERYHLSPLKVGGKVLFPESELNRFIEGLKSDGQ